jgi:hypothetical protein
LGVGRSWVAAPGSLQTATTGARRCKGACARPPSTRGCLYTAIIWERGVLAGEGVAYPTASVGFRRIPSASDGFFFVCFFWEMLCGDRHGRTRTCMDGLGRGRCSRVSSFRRRSRRAMADKSLRATADRRLAALGFGLDGVSPYRLLDGWRTVFGHVPYFMQRILWVWEGGSTVQGAGGGILLPWLDRAKGGQSIGCYRLLPLGTAFGEKFYFFQRGEEGAQMR